MSPDEIREHIEASIVDLIKQKVEAEEMSEDRAQQLAQIVLEKLKPGMSLEDLYKALPNLDDQFSEISHIIVPYLRDYEQGVAKPAVEQVSHLIKAGRYSEAQDLADRVIKQNVKLVWTGSSTASPHEPSPPEKSS
ncbi:MAG TPA: hypothetical protein VJB96_00330 [Patescibacteria group bacterium]|nr:hypothetical protein [Patescibacteria group bacterium]